MGSGNSLYRRLGRIGGRGEQRSFEVFVQFRRDHPFTHVGSVRAADADFAVMWAKEAYTRRSDCVGLWVVDRECIWAATGDEAVELFEKGYEKKYRLPGFVAHRHRELARSIQGDDAFETREESVE